MCYLIIKIELPLEGFIFYDTFLNNSHIPTHKNYTGSTRIINSHGTIKLNVFVFITTSMGRYSYCASSEANIDQWSRPDTKPDSLSYLVPSQSACIISVQCAASLHDARPVVLGHFRPVVRVGLL